MEHVTRLAPTDAPEPPLDVPGLRCVSYGLQKGPPNELRELGVPEYLIKHLAVLAELHGQGRFDRMTDDVRKLTGQKPMNMREFVKEHAAEFTRT